ncbi:putative disease resistance protein RGA1 isoform X2 [Citrus sinensis]|uniref:putative disease resistance protein RGA1 isoform X2 n=1 Tax=Citrus sinensis TaxID=2711 RepID=UPI002278FD6C|nr:putative disease resistance protein RGA1 isoform X2 [Citrus sinensis]
MAHAIVSSLLDQLKSIAQDQVKEKWRLVTGVEQEVGKLTTNLQAIQAVLEDAEQRQMKQDKAVTFWLDQLRDASYDMEDVLEEWITETRKLQLDEGGDDDDDDNDNAFVTLLTKVCSFFPSTSNCFGSFKQLSLRHDIAVKIREINKTLDDITSQKDRFKFAENVSNNVKKPERVRTTSLVDEGEICGRIDEKNELLSKLLGESSEQQKGLRIISLFGLGGIGKTTLAQLAFNNEGVKRKFDIVIWVCVSDAFEEIRIAKAILEVLDKSASSLGEFQSLMQQTQESIRGKKFFLVLDDVWDGDFKKWDPFFSCLKNGHHESKILITTRDRSVALQMGSIDIISVKELGEEECWSLFKQVAFLGRSFEDCEKLEPIGRKIACKCKGLPLAAKVIGNLLRSKRTVSEWQRILDSEMWKVEEIGKGLLPPLLLSYNDLPSSSMVKRCFSYCSVFPKDYNIRKEELITLWMAQCYLNSEEDEEMEIIGEEYFNILATRSFFQEFVKDYDDNVMSCKMHDIVHDFAQLVSREECLWVEINSRKESVINSFGEKVRHLGLNFEGGASFPMSTPEFNRLRTLLIYDLSPYSPSLNGSILVELFSKVACLRALVIRQWFIPLDDQNFIREIPENIGKLIHLKYLNLSELCIERLPETLCELYNLQKLAVRWCTNLRELPAGIGKLMNMRSLMNGQTEKLKYLPIGISRLTSLRTLEKFVVGGGVDGGSTCRLESLKNLQLLRECRVEGLSNVSHVHEAERLQLYNKKNLLLLHLEFGRVVDGEGEEGRRKNEKDKQLLEALQPPLNVEELWILFYGGNIFPKWLTLLTNLRELKLFSCVNCEHLPPLGKLLLEKLTLYNLISVKRVGDEFLGIEESSVDDTSSSSSVIAFPKLKSLKIEDLDELEEWNYRVTRKENISIVPRLSSLEIDCCPKLNVLPDHLLQTTTLQELSIRGCPILEERYRGEDYHMISHIPHTKL